MQIDVHERGSAVVVTVRGDLDWLSVPRLDGELIRAWESDCEAVILDLGGVDFADSSGIGSLVAAHRRAESERRRLAIVEGGNIRKVLQRYGLDRLLVVGATVDELLAGNPRVEPPTPRV